MPGAEPGKRKREPGAPKRSKRRASSGRLGEFASTIHALHNSAHADCHPACGWVLEHAPTGTALDAVALATLLGQLCVLEQLQILGCGDTLEQLVLPSFEDMRAVYATEAQHLADRVRSLLKD